MVRVLTPLSFLCVLLVIALLDTTQTPSDGPAGFCCCVFLPVAFLNALQGSISAFLSEIVKMEHIGNSFASPECRAHSKTLDPWQAARKLDALCSEYLFSSPSVGPITRMNCKCFISGHACPTRSDEEEHSWLQFPWIQINVLPDGHDRKRFGYFKSIVNRSFPAGSAKTNEGTLLANSLRNPDLQ